MTIEEQLEEENRALKEQVRISGLRVAELEAMVTDLRNSHSDVPITNQKSRWYKYESPTRIGEFDMLEVATYEMYQLRENGPWNCMIRLRYTTTTILLNQQEQINAFKLAFDNYRERT